MAIVFPRNTHQDIEELKLIHYSLNEALNFSRAKNQNQKSIYRDLIKAFHLFSKELQTLCSKINQQITQTTEQYQNSTYQFLSNSLLRLGQCARRVATKCRNEVLEPFTLFTQNYAQLSIDEISKIQQRLNNLKLHQQELEQQKQNYRLANNRLEKQKEQQTKLMLKIESNSQESKNELSKFNQSIRKLVQNISQSQKFYLGAVQKTNYEWIETKKQLQRAYVALSYNEQSRNSFCRKNAINCIKSLTQFRAAVDEQAQRKIQDNSRQLSDFKAQNDLQKKIKLRIQALVKSTTEEKYISYEQQKKQQRKKAILEEQNHLQNLFKKVELQQKKMVNNYCDYIFLKDNSQYRKAFVLKQYRPNDYQDIKQQLVQGDEQGYQRNYFEVGQYVKKQQINQVDDQSQQEGQNKKNKKTNQHLFPSKNLSNSSQIKKSETLNQRQLNSLKREILKPSEEQISCNSSNKVPQSTLNPIISQKEKDFKELRSLLMKKQYLAFYFIQNLYLKIVEMTSIYCKLEEAIFMSLNQDFLAIVNLLDIENSSKDIHIQFLYKIILISQRIVKKRNEDSLHIELLCSVLAKNTDKLHKKSVFQKLYWFLVRKKEQKKKQSKGMINNFTKGFFAAVTGRKDSLLSTDQHFGCIQELATAMSNLQVPTNISLPLLKELLGPNNVQAFNYLKSTILTKKDTAQRKKIESKKYSKDKRQQVIQSVIQEKKLVEFCIFLTAKKGFFSYKDIKLNQLSSHFKGIDGQILHQSKLPASLKWPKMVRLKRHIDYKKLSVSLTTLKDESTQQIIGLDVKRSLHLHTEKMDPQVLKRILRIYANGHPQISYCQGMNYIAGYLLIKTGNQQVCYYLFQELMETRFKELFSNQFEELRIKMYQFERLLAIYYPQVSEHFKRHCILPQCYLISWIITLFSSCYQYTMQSFLVDSIWERFILWGWTQFFKFVLWLFSLFKNELVDMSYDKALHFFGDLLKSTLFLAGNQEFVEKHPGLIGFQNQLDQFIISQSLLATLRKQFYLV